jgi:hypothetical protein
MLADGAIRLQHAAWEFVIVEDQGIKQRLARAASPAVVMCASTWFRTSKRYGHEGLDSNIQDTQLLPKTFFWRFTRWAMQHVGVGRSREAHKNRLSRLNLF